jgi:DNA invertase Pin-like site-specific DNA recombinase
MARGNEAATQRPRGRRVKTDVLARPTRRERVNQIEALAARGLGTRELAERTGLARSTVNKYRRDPEGE